MIGPIYEAAWLTMTGDTILTIRLSREAEGELASVGVRTKRDETGHAAWKA
jgi:hypothetical protein